MTMRVTLTTTVMGESGSLLAAGSTYTVSEAFGASLVNSGRATDTDRALTPAQTELKPYLATDPLTGRIDISAGSATITLAKPLTFSAFISAIALGYVGMAFITDVGGGSIWVSDGTRGRPLGGSMDLYNSSAVLTSTTSATRNVVSALAIVPGIWKDGDTLDVCIDVSKSGTSDTASCQLQLGASAAVVGTQVSSANIGLATTTVRGYATWRIRRNSATSITLLNSAAGGDGATSTVNVAANTVTVSNMNSATTYLQVTNAMTSAVETLSVEHSRLTIRAVV